MKRIKFMLVVALFGVLSFSTVQVNAAGSAGCRNINLNYSDDWSTLNRQDFGREFQLGRFQFNAGDRLELTWRVTFADGKPVANSTGTLHIPVISSVREGQRPLHPPATVTSTNGTGEGTVALDVGPVAADNARNTYISISVAGGYDNVSKIEYKVSCTPAAPVAAVIEDDDVTPVATEEASAEPTLEPTAAPTEAPPAEPTLEPTAAPTEAPPAEPTSVPTEEAPAEPPPASTEETSPPAEPTPEVTETASGT